MFKKLISLVFLIGCSTAPFQAELWNKKVQLVQGGVAKKVVADHVSKVICEKVSFPIFEKESQRFVLIVESYFSKRKKFNCVAYTKNQKELYTFPVKVNYKKYPFETLKVDRKRVQLNKKDLKRVIKEQKKLTKIYGKQSKKIHFDSSFELPLKSKVTSPYGMRRMFNNVRKSQHLGIDFRAKTGVKIPVSNSGKIVLAEDLFYTGNTVIVDHGKGVYTLYGHLSKVKVRLGQKVKRGKVIGLAGKTGRVTGPHLHWGVKINGHWVDGNTLTMLDLE